MKRYAIPFKFSGACNTLCAGTTCQGYIRVLQFKMQQTSQTEEMIAAVKIAGVVLALQLVTVTEVKVINFQIFKLFMNATKHLASNISLFITLQKVSFFFYFTC